MSLPLGSARGFLGTLLVEVLKGIQPLIRLRVLFQDRWLRSCCGAGVEWLRVRFHLGGLCVCVCVGFSRCAHQVLDRICGSRELSLHWKKTLRWTGVLAEKGGSGWAAHPSGL